MYRHLIIWFSFTILISGLQAQDHHRNSEPSTLNKEIQGGFVWHPRGLGISLVSGNRINERNWRLFDFDFISMKDPREYKIKSTGFSPSGLYSYGKINYAYFMRTGLGLKRELATRWYINTISTEVALTGGITTAFLKPVYLDIYYPLPDNNGYLVSERYDPKIHTDQQVIFGNSSFTRGLDQLQLRAGAYTKLSFSFDWSDYSDAIRSIELGGILDFYGRELPIMAFAENRKVFTSLYICLNIGSRW